ncbi:patatin-like phospholipase family protein [Roseateles violae]|uniref:Patatin-like phospholipase family protein n=1 Tax=Roseateles violae TaxID=3058042 RepID=A0ABT8DVJ7_9BURK|nr:patatin-like phospholipase family protein [Pelomonas sp. PFR6]MDN3922237.1 patatin-like phospholipase family protein [Pelomonas sp. PFR6]
MTTKKTTKQQRATGTQQRRPRIGLALAGGGPLGAIYEIGALCALEEAIAGLDCCDCEGYVGISAGGFIAAGLANGLSPRQLCAAFIDGSAAPAERFEPARLLQPAWDEFGQRARRLPALLARAGWDSLVKRRSLLAAAERLGRALPTGLLSSEALAAQLRRQFEQPGRSDDFRQLKRRLVLVATDLDSGEAVPFGMPGRDHVPISRAAQASAALPGLYPPVEIEGRHYVDGALKKTIHASLLLDEGVDLLICLNPLVPYRAEASAPIPSLVDGGLPLVLSQTLRSLIRSRLELGLRGYENSHPDTDILLFEPDPGDAEIFMANTFSYSKRRHLAEHAYQATRAALRERAPRLREQLGRHGLALREEVLADASRRLLSSPAPTRTEAALQRLRADLDRLEAAYAR